MLDNKIEKKPKAKGILQGQRILVLGACCGFGRGMARALTASGAQVIAADANAEGLKQLTGAVPLTLKGAPEEALRRVGRTSGRPLLNRPDAPAFARDLLRRRVKRYALAHHLYDTSSAAPQEIAERIRSAVRPWVTGLTKKEE